MGSWVGPPGRTVQRLILGWTVVACRIALIQLGQYMCAYNTICKRELKTPLVELEFLFLVTGRAVVLHSPEHFPAQ